MLSRCSWGMLVGVLILGGVVPAEAEISIAYVGAARIAKTLCSGVFVSGLEADDVLRDDLDYRNPDSVNAIVDRENKTVTVTLVEGEEARAIYREGCGCTLLNGRPEEEVRGQFEGALPAAVPLSLEVLWPEGEKVSSETGLAKKQVRRLGKVLDDAMAEPFSTKKRGTRAVVVVHKGRIVGERYGEGFSKDTPLIAWSMTKSVTCALTGILVGEGKLVVKDPAPVSEWRGEGDPRGEITLDMLLRMSSGLEFAEEYGAVLSDVVVMLFGEPDSAAFTANKPLETEPDTKWAYSSGTTNIIARILRDAVGGSMADYFAFPREALFDRIGMLNTVIEPDASGTLVGSSFMYSTARDLARFGLLCLQDGVWRGERILPEGWIDYCTTPTPAAPMGIYGAQFWLNAGDPKDPSKRAWPDVPADAFYCSGFDVQRVIMVPSRETVIVRLGRTPDSSAWDVNAFIAGVLKALPE